MTYRRISEITLPKNHKETIAELYPENQIKEKGDNIVILDDKEKTIVDFCEGLCHRNKEEFTTKDTKNLMVSVESFGQMTATELFNKTVSMLKDNLNDLSKSF